MMAMAIYFPLNYKESTCNYNFRSNYQEKEKKKSNQMMKPTSIYCEWIIDESRLQTLAPQRSDDVLLFIFKSNLLNGLAP